MLIMPDLVMTVVRILGCLAGGWLPASFHEKLASEAVRGWFGHSVALPVAQFAANLHHEQTWGLFWNVLERRMS